MAADRWQRTVEDLVSKRWYKWFVVALLCIVGFLNAVDRHSIYAIFPALERELGMSSVQLGMLGSAFVWPYGLLGPFAGYAGDRFPRRNVIMVSLLAWSAVTGLNALTTSPNQLIVLRALLAVSEAFYLPTALAMLSDHHSEKTRSKAIGIHLSTLAFAQVAGGFLGGYFAEHLRWRTLFGLLGLVGIILVPVLYLMLHAPFSGSKLGTKPKLDKSLIQATAELVSIPSLRYFALAFLCYSMVGGILATWLPYFFFRKFQMSMSGSGFSANFFLEMPTALGNLAGGAVGDYYATRTYRGRMLVQACSLGLSAPMFLAVGLSGTVPQVAASLVLLGFLRGAWAPNVMPVICQVVPDKLRATTYGIINSLGNVGMGIAILVAGGLGSRFGFSGVYASCSLGYWLMAGLLLFTAFRRLKKDFRLPSAT